MKTIDQYYNLVRLDPSGRVRLSEIATAKDLIAGYFRKLLELELAHSQIQHELLAGIDEANITRERINYCLRCFISHQIRQICISLEQQFGREHNFTRSDLFLYTLNDTLDNFRANRAKSSFKPLAVVVLEKFDPKKASLSTWTARIVKQDRELQRFLLQQGVYLISNWAILNDTSEKQLKRVLNEYHSLTPTEIDKAAALLVSYHDVYRSDRSNKTDGGKGKKCQTPTEEQLERISALFAKETQISLSIEQTLSALELLASQLREYRIYVRGGKRKQEQSFDNAELNTEGLQASAITSEEETADRGDFLTSYKQQFQTSLNTALDKVVQLRLSKFKGKKAAKKPQYIKAMELFHCQGVTMGKIAPEVGLKAQFEVSRLLKLKALRADIRQQMLQTMGDWVTGTAGKFEDINILKSRENAIAEALGEQIDTLLEEAEKETSIAGSNRSLLAQKICDYIHTVNC